MKIFTVAKIREADDITIERQGITSLELMERAGHEVYKWLKYKFPDKETVFHVFCGKGNNGGDGLVIARHLHDDKYKVHLHIIGQGSPSADFSASLEKVNDAGIEYNNNPPSLENANGKSVVIDAIFGIGLSREPEGEFRTAIETINDSKSCIISVDVPSGLFLDRPASVAVEADIVLTFQFPKLALYLSSNYRFAETINVIDIGLDKDFIDSELTNHYVTNTLAACERYRPIPWHAHKGTLGHSLIIGGSYGKAGAPLLSAKAALTAGCGLVTALVPESAAIPIQTSFPEAMVITGGQNHISTITFDIEPKAVGIGPGLGKHEETQTALYGFLQSNTAPMVIDADALNILSENAAWLELLPAETILTPHPKELQRLVGSWKDDFERLEKIKAFSLQYNVIVIAKDARTMVIHGHDVFINSTGNAALATAGSGDVLTGMLTSLLAQGYTPQDAAVLGVYLQGVSADIGVADTGTQAFTASHIISNLGKAFLKLEAREAFKLKIP